MNQGFVYFAHCGSSNTPHGYVKIGFGADPIFRLSQIREGKSYVVCPDGIYLRTMELLGILPGTKKTERLLHILFRHNRVAGEWFESTPTFLEVMRSFGLHGLNLPTSPVVAIRSAKRYYKPRQETVFLPEGELALPPKCRFLTIKEASHVTGLSFSHVKSLVESGELTGRKFGRDWLIHRDQFTC